MKQEHKELFEEQLAADLNNKEKEIERLIKSIDESQEVLDEMKKVAELWKQAIDKYTSPSMVKKLEPAFGFETDDGYWELQSALIKLEQLRRFFVLTDKDIPSMEDTLTAKRENLKGLQEVVNKMKEGDKNE